MKDEKFDELFDEAFDRAVQSASPVDPESRRAAWQRVQKARQQHSGRRQRKRTLRLTSAAAGLILLGSFAFSEPVRTGALTPLYQKLQTWSTGEAVVVRGDHTPVDTEGALTDPPPEGVEQPTSSSTQIDAEPNEKVVRYDNVEMSLADATRRLAFPMPEFPKIPQDLKLEKVTLAVPDDGSAPDSFTLFYESGTERNATIYVSRMIGPDGTYSFGTDQVTEVRLANGLTAQYADQTGEDIVHLIRGELDFFIYGLLSREELLDIAGHIVDGRS
ncbi:MULTISPECIES: hypothetical protein [Saccharibacillus]|uniref:hypothetical protein n=1 Tax=Saccharibacillus TaxID=456492 RepID=UPI00123A4C9B|nr:hypothetical protein [Saccharibacillus sp. WB 17]MWJ30454.1 hypothetical protein [Saccharibacillus sp. WB 17]